MKSFQYHILGITETFKTLSKGKLLIFFLPGAILTLLYISFTAYTSSFTDAVDLTTGYSWLDWFDSLIKYTFSFLYFIIDQIYIFIVLTVLSPFNTFLGEKFDNQLTGRTIKFDFTRFINEIFRMIFVIILIVFIEITFIFFYWLISWIIPDFIDDIVYYIIAAFFFGFSFYDFSLERYEVGVFGSLGYAFSNPLSMIITGTIFLLLYNIPYIGIPISPVLTVMISTVVYLNLEKILPKKKEEIDLKELNSTNEIETKEE